MPPHLEEHGAVLVSVRRLNVVGCAGVSAPCGAHDDSLPRLPLHAPRQAAAARAELLRLLEARVLQDALRESPTKAALAGAAGQTFTFKDTHTTVMI